MHRNLEDITAIASLVAHREEKIINTESFYRTWTRKEAVMKQLGLGVNLEPRLLRVIDAPAMHLQWMPTSIDGAAEAPYVTDVPAPQGVFAAVATEHPGPVNTFLLKGGWWRLDYSLIGPALPQRRWPLLARRVDGRAAGAGIGR